VLTAEEAVDPADPMLWWAARDAPALAGMAAPHEGFPFGVLAGLGFDAIVSLTGPTSYDPAPLFTYHYTLRDLFGQQAPPDPQAELAAVARAVQCVRSLRDAGQGVVVHCGAGIGRTGLVIGAVLVGEGETLTVTCAWLDAVQRRRCARGWPESPWQLEALRALATAG
jgi:protein-tyrosine phosphatase